MHECAHAAAFLTRAAPISDWPLRRREAQKRCNGDTRDQLQLTPATKACGPASKMEGDEGRALGTHLLNR
eukprot:2116612-Alexandrium_andersonii.AAC.1